MVQVSRKHMQPVSRLSKHHRCLYKDKQPPLLARVKWQGDQSSREKKALRFGLVCMAPFLRCLQSLLHSLERPQVVHLCIRWSGVLVKGPMEGLQSCGYSTSCATVLHTKSLTMRRQPEDQRLQLRVEQNEPIIRECRKASPVLGHIYCCSADSRRTLLFKSSFHMTGTCIQPVAC